MYTNFEKELMKYTSDISEAYIKELSLRNYDIANQTTFYIKKFGQDYKIMVNLPFYWKYIENGRKPGTYPPPDAIITWIKKKNILPQRGTSINQLSFLISRKIYRKGIQPKNLLYNSYKNKLKDLKKLTERFTLDIVEGLSSEIKIKK